MNFERLCEIEATIQDAAKVSLDGVYADISHLAAVLKQSKKFITGSSTVKPLLSAHEGSVFRGDM